MSTFRINASVRPHKCWYCETPDSSTAWRDGRAVCTSCDGFMEQGVICIGVKELPPADMPSVFCSSDYRDGNWCVITRDEYQSRFGRLPAQRIALVEPKAWLRLGLPKQRGGAVHRGAMHYDKAQER